MPDHDDCLERAAALRRAGDTGAADGLLLDLVARTQFTPEILIALGLNAQTRTDWAEALRLSSDGRQRFPTYPVFWASEIAMLQIMGRLEEAGALGEEGVRRFPDTIDVAVQAATVATARHDWLRALTDWAAIFERFAEHPYVGENRARVTERIRQGLAELPSETLVRGAVAFEAERRWEPATRLWTAVGERRPDDALPRIGLGRVLRESGAHDEADRVLDRAMRDHPGDVELAANHAEVAVARGDRTEAVRRWREVLRRFPDTPVLWSMAATAHREAGSFDEAGELLARAIEREPERVELRVHHALLAERQGDWPLAVRRWDVAHRLRPDDLNIQNSRGDALWQEAALHLEAGTTPAAGPDAPAPTADAGPSRRELALRFEGMGDNCEFGVVQRRFGADPIGLLRFAAISSASLIALLHERFDRLGDPDHTELGLTEGEEYLVRDDRGLFHMHSFVRRGSVDERRFLQQQVKRLGYLKRKIIEDLTAAQKIFVYKSSVARIDDDTILRLHRALELYGPNVLLVTRLAEADQPPGSVTVLREGALVGHLDSVYGGDNQPIDFDSWQRIMSAAVSHRAELVARAAEPAPVARSTAQPLAHHA